MLLQTLLILFAAGFAILLYLRIRERKGTSDPEQETTSETLSCGELLVKIGILTGAGRTEVWDYDLQTDRFHYLRIGDAPSSPFEGFTFAQYVAQVDPEDRPIVIDTLTGMREQRIDRSQDTFRIKDPGTEDYHWLDVIVQVAKRDKAGNPLSVTGYWLDITERLEQNRKLQEDRTLLQMAMQASEFVPWSFDFNRQDVTSDNNGSQFFDNNTPIAEYIDKLVHPDHQEFFRQQLNNIVSHKTREVDFKVQVRYEEVYEWVHIVGKVVDNLANGSTKVIGTRSIITKTVEREKELEELRRKAEEANTQKSAFLANMGHEIRSPLNAIVGFSGLLAEEAGSEECREYCHIIEANTELLMQLVGDILDMAKIEAGQLEFNLTEVDLCRLLEDLEQTYKMKISEPVKLLCTLPDEACPLKTDRNRLMQVISNLLNNAVKYTAQGSITIGYDHLPDQSGVRIFVRDTGRGIEPENLPTVFERFAKFNPDVPGTGLGLSICHTIVQHLGGEIGVESEPGKGSEFWFTLPNK